MMLTPANQSPFFYRRTRLPRRSLAPLHRQAAPKGLLVWDDFSDSDGVSLPDHAPNIAPAGASWSNSNLGISNNQVHFRTAANRQFAVIECGAANCKISLRCCQDANGVFTATSEFRSGVIARYSSPGNFWRIVFHPVGGFAIYEVNAGVTATRASRAFTTGYGVFHTLSVILNGSTILAQIDGGNTLSYDQASFNQNASMHGLALAYSGAVPAADDFRVEPI